MRSLTSPSVSLSFTRAASLCALLALALPLHSEVVSAFVPMPKPAETGYFKLGSARNPAGQTIGVNSRSLLIDGQAVFPVMGEIHYSRIPKAEWREELRKMKDGGVQIVATYVFWIHHEEEQGRWDWSGQRDLRSFVETCRELGLKAVIRCGPWCHGEVRNGGLPDWVQARKDWKLRSTDANFMAATKVLYGEIARQLKGELWKDGGPVIGIQLDNEFGGAPEYLLGLKAAAIEAGMDVPLYLHTGWPATITPMPLGEMLPLFGAYADGFWTGTTKPMPGKSWANFIFKLTRTDTGVGNDTLKVEKEGDTVGTEKYPYLTCEVGGGMPASYHRRMNYDPRDVEAVVLTQLGGGGSMLGYYMYHGGQNPEGKLSTLQESQVTGYPNDLPVKSYDFNAPIGEFGQLNPQYYWMRRLHYFLHDFGGQLAQMPAFLPDNPVVKKEDLETLRWSVRSDGVGGYVLVNNYQRLQPLAAKKDVQFILRLASGDFVFPSQPVTIPADSFFIWPFNVDLGGVRLRHATAQLVCRAGDTVYFAETPGVKAEFAFDPTTLDASSGSQALVSGLAPRREAAFTLKAKTGAVLRVVLLSEADSLSLRREASGRVFFEAPASPVVTPVATHCVKQAGPARVIPLSSAKTRNAMAPEDADFAQAAVWKITLPSKVDLKKMPLLRLRYVGDVARLTLNGRLIADNFYSGREFDLGLARYGEEIITGDLRLEILPLRKDAPLFFEPSHRPDFGTRDTLLELRSAELVVGQ